MATPQLPFEETLSPKALTTIGLLMVTAANCEAGLFFQALRFHGPKPTAQACQALSGQELRVRLKGIRDMAAMHMNADAANEAKRLCDKIEKAYEKRHMFAHSMVCSSPRDPETLIVMTTKIGASFPTPQEWRLEQIAGFAKAIHAAVKELQDTMTALGLPLLDHPPPAT